MREGLTEALNDFPGALVLVSHDRALVRACCETLLLVGGGRFDEYSGDLDDYARGVQRASGGERLSSATAAAPATQNRRDGRRDRAEQRARTAALRKNVQGIEQRLTQLDELLSKTEAALADASLYDGAHAKQINDFTRKSGELKSKRQALEEEWLQAQAELEQATAT
jgi:ATP-binding cassette subfamily F protein 3